MKKPKFLKALARSLGESMLRFGGADSPGLSEETPPLITIDETCQLKRITYRSIFDKLSMSRNSPDYIKKREENKAHNEAYKFIQGVVKVNQRIEGDYLVTWIDCKVAFFNQDVDESKVVESFLTGGKK